MKLSPPLRSLAIAFRIPLQQQPQIRAFPPDRCRIRLLPPSKFCFSTTPQPQARNAKGPKRDPRITMIRYHLQHPRTPRPLRFSRSRALRHWTIHRAAQLLLHRDRTRREKELERQYNAMRGAMEELRLGVGDGGKLYRQAVSRKGIFGGLKVAEAGGVVGNGGIPLEYARGQTEGPSREGWDHGWTRG